MSASPPPWRSLTEEELQRCEERFARDVHDLGSALFATLHANAVAEWPALRQEASQQLEAVLQQAKGRHRRLVSAMLEMLPDEVDPAVSESDARVAAELILSRWYSYLPEEISDPEGLRLSEDGLPPSVSYPEAFEAVRSSVAHWGLDGPVIRSALRAFQRQRWAEASRAASPQFFGPERWLVSHPAQEELRLFPQEGQAWSWVTSTRLSGSLPDGTGGERGRL